MIELKLKRYLLFAGQAWQAGGGWNDYQGSFETYQEACDAIGDCDWFHIVDIYTGEETHEEGPKI